MTGRRADGGLPDREGRPERRDDRDDDRRGDREPAPRAVVAAEHHQEAEPDRGEAERPGRELLPQMELLRRALDLHVQVRRVLKLALRRRAVCCPGRNRSACLLHHASVSLLTVRAYYGRSSSATFSTCGVCGNMSTGVTRRSS